MKGYNIPDFKEHFAQKSHFFATTVNPHGELRFLKQWPSQTQMIWGQVRGFKRPALKNVIFASHGVGNGNLCPLCCRPEKYKEGKNIFFCSRLTLGKSKEEPLEAQLFQTIMGLLCREARAAQRRDSTRIIFQLFFFFFNF